MAKLKQTPAHIAPKPSLAWRLYPAAWCLIGLGAGAYVFTSDSSARLLAALDTESSVAERRIADAENRATTAVRQLERAKDELRDERSRVVALNIRIDKLTADLREANATRMKAANSGPSGVRTTPTTTASSAQPQSTGVTTTVVNTTPVEAPATEQPDTSRLVTFNAPSATPTAAVPDPNAPPVPVRVPQQARMAALAAARSRETSSRITTGSITPRAPEREKSPDRAPSATRNEPSAAATSPWSSTPSPSGPAAAPQRPDSTDTAGVNTSALRLASAPSLTSLRQSWAVLVDKHPAILQGLSPRYRDITSASGRSFQLIAGPLLSRGEAIQLCAMLQVRAVSCGVDNYAGSPL
jgi:hypothetical protein